MAPLGHNQLLPLWLRATPVFGSQCEDTVPQDRAASAVGRKWVNTGSRLAFSFVIQPWTLAHWMLLPTFWVGLPISISNLETPSQTHPRLVALRNPGLAKLSIYSNITITT